MKTQNHNIQAARVLAVFIPVLTAGLLSFGYDAVVWRIAERTNMINDKALKQLMVFSNLMLVLCLYVAVLSAHHMFLRIVRKELIVPLGRLSEGMRQMRDGNLDYRITYEENDEHSEIYADFNEMAVETRRLMIKTREIDKGRREFLLDISHDLRSPLTSIIAYVQGILDGIAKTPDDKRRYLITIREKALDIEKMVNRLFLYAKLDTGKYNGNPERICAGTEIRELVEALRGEYASRGLTLVCETEGNTDIYADPEIFRRVCVNLIENSCKYKKGDSGTLWIRTREEKHKVRVTFHDNGPGVAEDELPHLWDIFYRSDEARSNPREGSGIGLAIVKKAVGNMKGRVVAKNAKEGGLEITIRIPKLEDENEKDTNHRG